MTAIVSTCLKATDFIVKSWKSTIDKFGIWKVLGALLSVATLLTSIFGILIAATGVLLDAFYQSGSRSEPVDVRFQPRQGVPIGTFYTQSTECNMQRIRELRGDKPQRGGIDACAELEKMNEKNLVGGGRMRAVFSNKGPEVIENLTAELVLVLDNGQTISKKNEREAMGVDEYEHILIIAKRGFVSHATLCLTFDQPWGRRRNLIYALSDHERSEAEKILLNNEQDFQLRRTEGYFPRPFNQFSAPKCPP